MSLGPAPIYDQRHRYAGLKTPGAYEDMWDAERNADDHRDGLYDEGDHHEPRCGLAAEVHGEHWAGPQMSVGESTGTGRCTYI